MNRRGLIITAGAASLAPLAARAGEAVADPSAITAVLYDRRYEAARRFAEALTRRGAIAFAADGDVVKLWRGPIGDLAAAPGFRLAGMTAWSDASLVEALARERGCRPVCEGLHDGREAGRLVHTLRHRGPDGGLAAACAGPGWPAALADAFAVRGGPQGPVEEQRVLAPADASLEASTTMSTWLIS